MKRALIYIVINGFLALVVLQNWSGRPFPVIDFLTELITLPFIAIQLILSAYIMINWMFKRQYPGFWERMNLAGSILIVWSFI